ncbi:Uncharacterised protein [Chryseobacterium nakagawai]|nr:Uncharacterised protein [Chryseobacterium nakagawai]
MIHNNKKTYSLFHVKHKKSIILISSGPYFNIIDNQTEIQYYIKSSSNNKVFIPIYKADI